MSLTVPSGVERFEIVQGEVIALGPTGGRHGKVEGNAYYLLASHIKPRRLGHLYVGEVGVVIASDPLTVRGADVAFISSEREPVEQSPEGYLLTPPTLVLEVLSRNDRASEVEAKTQDYLQIGVLVVVLLDPENLCATLARPDATRVVLQASQALELPDLLPGWSVSVADFFEE